MEENKREIRKDLSKETKKDVLVSAPTIDEIDITVDEFLEEIFYYGIESWKGG